MRKVLLTCSMLLAVFAASAFGQDEEVRKGVDLYQDGKFSESVAILEKFLVTDPDHWAAWIYLGGSLANLGREQEAIAALKMETKGKRDFKIVYDKELKVTKKVKAVYTSQARKNRLEGHVTVRVEFRADGTIGFIVPIKPLPHGLTETAIEAARKMSFLPAQRNGKPVSVIRLVAYVFS